MKNEQIESDTCFVIKITSKHINREVFFYADSTLELLQFIIFYYQIFVKAKVFIESMKKQCLLAQQVEV